MSIQSKADFIAYLEADRLALGVPDTWRMRLTHEVWQFQRALRRLEYVRNCRKPLPLRVWAWYRHRKLSIQLGFTIPPNVFGPGLSIAHRGTIVVNHNARVGANCRIHVCVNVGVGKDNKAPVIGDRCYIGPGAKLFGGIVIADGVHIGANAVVNRSFLRNGVSIAGVPAKELPSVEAHHGNVAGSVNVSP